MRSIVHGVFVFSALLAVMIGPVSSADAIPITYSYTGNVFTTYAAAGTNCNLLGPACMGNPFLTWDHLIASVTLDVTIGTSASGMAPTGWSIDVGHGASGTATKPSVGTTNLGPCLNPALCAGSGGSFSVDASGNISGWILTGRTGQAGTILETDSSNMDRAIWDGLPYSGWNRDSPGTWTVVATPETSSLVLLGLGLAGILTAKRRFVS